MRTRRARGSLVLLAFLVGACSPDPTPVGTDPSPESTDDATRAEVGDTVRLRVGETVEVGDHGLRIRFEDVPSDSRCPTGVTCVWAGDAAVRLALSLGGDPEMMTELHTNEGPEWLRHEGHTVTLIGLDPHPENGSKIATDTYVAALRITRP